MPWLQRNAFRCFPRFSLGAPSVTSGRYGRNANVRYLGSIWAAAMATTWGNSQTQTMNEVFSWRRVRANEKGLMRISGMLILFTCPLRTHTHTHTHTALHALSVSSPPHAHPSWWSRRRPSTVRMTPACRWRSGTSSGSPRCCSTPKERLRQSNSRTSSPPGPQSRPERLSETRHGHLQPSALIYMKLKRQCPKRGVIRMLAAEVTSSGLFLEMW